MNCVERASQVSSAGHSERGSGANEQANGSALYASISHDFDPLCGGRDEKARERPQLCDISTNPFLQSQGLPLSAIANHIIVQGWSVLDRVGASV